ncbi:hypothetical protein N7450_004214 [Penicillium hetheringtonii]|uniref:Uncharacterized protein n=1 Tax=Penicillium hetheringtonii TaxID=911720 RepID=A0AAD6DPL4_9EURO|nr:hypothetical protein N7450_004214 [Penicillium hetheringtonii]
MAVTWRGDLHMDTAPAVFPSRLEIKSLETAVVELPTKCSTTPPSPSQPLSKMDIPKVKRIDPPTTTAATATMAAFPDSPPTSTNRPRRASRPTSATGSAQHSRSNSRSTARSRPPSRHGSLHSSRRAVTTASIVPVPPARPSPHERRASLLALHRESCRLFQEMDDTANVFPDDIRSVPALSRAPSSTYNSRRELDGRTSSDADGSGPPSPVASSQSSRRFEFEHRNSISSTISPIPLQHRDRSNTLPSKTPEYNSEHIQSSSASSIHVPATVMEWTSPESRRAEYEKIDRAGRGVRGLWRRVAPRWCQTREARTPFFEEGNTCREGSVRRFRMDLPDEELENTEIAPHEKSQVQIFDFLGKGTDHGPRRWIYRRSKTSPA